MARIVSPAPDCPECKGSRYPVDIAVADWSPRPVIIYRCDRCLEEEGYNADLRGDELHLSAEDLKRSYHIAMKRTKRSR